MARQTWWCSPNTSKVSVPLEMAHEDGSSANRSGRTMLKRLLEWWRTWEVAVDGIDDLEGEHMASLEERLARLEQEVAQMQTEEQRRNRCAPIDRCGSSRATCDPPRGSCSCGWSILVSGWAGHVARHTKGLNLARSKRARATSKAAILASSTISASQAPR